VFSCPLNQMKTPMFCLWRDYKRLLGSVWGTLALENLTLKTDWLCNDPLSCSHIVLLFKFTQMRHFPGEQERFLDHLVTFCMRYAEVHRRGHARAPLQPLTPHPSTSFICVILAMQNRTKNPWVPPPASAGNVICKWEHSLWLGVSLTDVYCHQCDLHSMLHTFYWNYFKGIIVKLYYPLANHTKRVFGRWQDQLT
jgi:hypothetical protein